MIRPRTDSPTIPTIDMPDTLDTPLVAVITRTKDRPLLLQRALESVSGQSLTDIQWVIVNDGGEPAPV
ncbi:glycosyltransferase, partial [Accumulibacter sp.]|uniref:glycosyltransferase n=1 Tax=Accumulibacter sp. TaxID=2053492 RepID=UPI0034334654